MPISVSSAFRNQLQNQVPENIIRKFTFSNSDHTDSVLNYGSISRKSDSVTTGDMSIQVSNADQRWNVLQSDKSLFTGSGTLKFGFNINNSEEVVTLFSGTLRNMTDSTKGKVTLSFQDRLTSLNTRIVGNNNNPVFFTGSQWNPADLFWTVATSWGELSNIQSTSNPDIDYASWLDFGSRSTAMGFFIQAHFTGQSVAKIFQDISRLTGTSIVGEIDGKINTVLPFPVPTTTVVSYSGDKIRNISNRKIGLNKIINDTTILIGFDPSDNTWNGSINKEATFSINSFGRQSKIFQDTSVWHVNSASAISFAERFLSEFDEPVEELKINTLLEGSITKMSDIITLTEAMMSYSARSLKVTRLDVNLNDGVSQLVTRDSEILDQDNWFVLDATFNGYLDRTDNPLF